jgi:hypothetical protein
MVSLTTVYFVSIVLASIVGMSSGFLGNKIYPLNGGAVSNSGDPPLNQETLSQPESQSDIPNISLPA